MEWLFLWLLPMLLCWAMVWHLRVNVNHKYDDVVISRLAAIVFLVLSLIHIVSIILFIVLIWSYLAHIDDSWRLKDNKFNNYFLKS